MAGEPVTLPEPNSSGSYVIEGLGVIAPSAASKTRWVAYLYEPVKYLRDKDGSHTWFPSPADALAALVAAAGEGSTRAE